MDAGDVFVSGVILAAGTASRMGRPKQLLPLGDRPLLEWAVDAAAASCLAETVLVLGHRAEEIRPAIRLPRGRVRAVVNADHALGQSTSLRLGIRSLDPRAAAAAILLGDQPHVTAPLIDRVVSAFLAADFPAARPVYRSADGRRTPGHPVILARRLWPALEELEGDEGARAVLSARPEWVLEVPVEGDAPADIDTGEDYRRAVDAPQAQKISQGRPAGPEAGQDGSDGD